MASIAASAGTSLLGDLSDLGRAIKINGVADLSLRDIETATNDPFATVNECLFFGF